MLPIFANFFLTPLSLNIGLCWYLEMLDLVVWFCRIFVTPCPSLIYINISQGQWFTPLGENLATLMFTWLTWTILLGYSWALSIITTMTSYFISVLHSENHIETSFSLEQNSLFLEKQIKVFGNWYQPHDPDYWEKRKYNNTTRKWLCLRKVTKCHHYPQKTCLLNQSDFWVFLSKQYQWSFYSSNGPMHAFDQNTGDTRR